jgi:DNA-binding transcriptional LysR family regulator
MNLKQLQYFCTLADELHFRRAAHKLNLTQSPLSIAIRILEEDVGGALFDRNQRSVQLMELGRILLRHAVSILERSMPASRSCAPSCLARRVSIGSASLPLHRCFLRFRR